MSVARPARCLFCRFSQPAFAVPRVARRQFHLTPARFAEDQPPKDNKAPAPAAAPERKVLKDIEREMKPENFKPYTEQEKEHLSKIYSPKQMEAVEAGEAAIDPKDLAEQFAFQRGPLRHHYTDDFSAIEPGVDKHVRAPLSNTDYNAELKTEDDFMQDFGRFLAEMPENVSAGDWVRFVEGLRVTKGKPENELNPHTSLVPDLFQPGESLDEDPKPPKPEIATRQAAQEGEGMDDALRTLLKSTGYTESQIRGLRVKALVRRSVSNQTRLGKIHKSYYLAIAGNGDGLLGIGEGKSLEGMDASLQARYRAIRSMQPIPRYENRTIYGDVKGKVGAVQLTLMNRAPGFGIRCQHLIYEMCRACGIHDLAARVDRSRNPMNTVKAAYNALMSQRDPQEIARARGKKLVDVRGVYYSGRAA